MKYGPMAADGRPDMWKVVRDSSGYHRAVFFGQQLYGGEFRFDDEIYSYEEASIVANDLNTVFEVMAI